MPLLSAEILAPLTDDERAVLMIASQGAPMIPIGRWERPIKALARRGFMQMLDAMNYVITEAGRAAMNSAEQAAQDDFTATARRAHDAGII